MSVWRAALAAASRVARASSTAQRAAAGACAAAAAASTAISSSSRLGFAASQQHRLYAAALCAAAAATVAFPPSTAHAAATDRSFIMVKPDGVQRGLVSEVVSRFERKGYKLVGIKVVVPTPALASEHYAEHKDRPFFPKLVDFLSSGPVVAMVWEGSDVVKVGRAMIGSTNPAASPPGTIRGDFGVETGRNIIHGSDSDDSARREIALWFKEGEIAEYRSHSEKWVYE